ncbi:MAG TPA: hypothetical protein VF185_00040 [Patescibacteria group bacterium]
MTKRQKFVFTSLILSLGFIGINFLDNNYRFLAIGVLTLLTVVLFVWSLWEGLGRNWTLLTLVLPALYTLGVGTFWFLLPATIFARIPVVILFGLGIYALCLTSNIFTVSAVRTIALVRAARGVGFVLTLLTSFLLFDAILSIKAQIWITTLGVVASSFALFLQGFWISVLEQKNILASKTFFYTLISSLGIGEIAVLLFFWPVTVVVGSLFLTVGVYMLLGLGQAKLEGRLFKATVREYLTVGLVVFITMLFATHWG